MLYTSYGLVIASELALPELIALPEGREEAEADVRIGFGAIAPEGLAGGEQLGPFLWASRDALWLHITGVARFLVTRGREIRVDPEAGIDEESLRTFLLGSAFGALLFQRGLLVLHGNAIRIGDQCLVCAGPSGAGKSTLAAGFMQRGYPILADDVVPVDARCRALPGFPRIKLWRDVADYLAIDTAGLRRLRPGFEKFNLPVVTDGASEPLPIRWVYILNSEHVDALRIDPIQGMHRFGPLYKNTYRMRFLNGMALKPEHLKLCGQLAARIHLARITRPRANFDLDTMIDALLADIAANP
ncbi:hypothetical protein [Endothiovibrio diazotrophicus]